MKINMPTTSLFFPGHALDVSVAQELITAISDLSPNMDDVRRLFMALSKSYDLNTLHSGRSFLSLAVEKRRLDVIKLILCERIKFSRTLNVQQSLDLATTMNLSTIRSILALDRDYFSYLTTIPTDANGQQIHNVDTKTRVDELATIFEKACMHDHLLLCKLCVKQGCDTSIGLCVAAMNNSIRVAEYLLNDNDFDLINSRHTTTKKTPLMLAAEFGAYNVLKLLFNHPGVDLEAKDMFGRTAISWASQNAHNHCLTILLQKKGHPHSLDHLIESTDVVGKHSLQLALENYGRKVQNFINNVTASEAEIQHYGWRAAHWFETNNPFTTMRILLYWDTDKTSAYFLWACERGYVAIIKILTLDNRIDFANIINKDGKTGLMLACENNRVAAVTVMMRYISLEGILKKGADGRSAIAHATDQDIVNMIKKTIIEKQSNSEEVMARKRTLRSFVENEPDNKRHCP